jgi:hypothetical protein
LTSVYFEGNAPSHEPLAFADDTEATAYYLPGTAGWADFSANNGVYLWNPLGPSGHVSIGVQSNQFGFNFNGPGDLLVVVEATTNLADPVWIPLETNTLRNGSFNFSEPLQTNISGRYYRIRLP